MLDSRRGKVLQFDSELNPIGVFGGTGDQRGFFRGAAALEKQGEAYLIADGDKNTITRMVPTGYIRTVREALAGYRQGEYARSEELWNEVLASNPHFTVAYRSIGRALLADGDCRRRWNTCGRATTGIIIRSPCRNTAGISSGTTYSGCCPPCSPSWRGWLWLAPLETMAAILMSHERRGSHVQPAQIPAAEPITASGIGSWSNPTAEPLINSLSRAVPERFLHPLQTYGV